MLIKRLPGVKTPHNKNTADIETVRMPIPTTVSIPVSMHIGAPAKPIVKPGDKVKLGQLIAEASGFVSANIHASVSGTVKMIEDHLTHAGQMVPSILIEPDGLQTVDESVVPPVVNDLPSFLDAVRASGIVGLGGAGFPLSVKLAVKDLSMIKAIIINGAECEPYITSDTRTMIEDSGLVWDGIKLLKKYLEAKRIIIAIEENKKKCIDIFRNLVSSDPVEGVEVVSLPAVYPQGGEKVLIYNTTGGIVPEGKLPIDAGAIVINCTTLATLAKYIETGMPLVEKRITVDGSAVAEPKNIIAPIGTCFKDIFDFCGGFKTEPKKILSGGPMMGIAVYSLYLPLMKSTNAILAFDEKDTVIPKETSCIKCGRCVSHCPLKLMPCDIERAYKLNKPELLEKLKVNLCMECGCCSYICPARRPLVQTNKLSKILLRKFQAARKVEEDRLQARAENKLKASAANGKAVE